MAAPKINTGTRTKAQDAEALASVVNPENLSSDQTVVQEEGKTFIVQPAFGVTVKTRVA